MNTLNCSACGACCRRIGRSLEYLSILGFPYGAKEDGSCEMLEGNLCKIYEERPQICRVDRMAELYKNKKKYYQDTKDMCNKFQEEDGMDVKYRLV